MHVAKAREIDNLGAFSPEDFCRRYGIGNTKLYEEIKSGRLRAVKVGVRTLILHADAKAWERSLPTVR
jgi:excisionase family DNA binding protein